MKVVDLHLAKIAIRQALSSEEVPAYAIFVYIATCDRLMLAPRQGFIHGGLFAAIRDDLNESERAVPIPDRDVYDGHRTIRLSNGMKPPTQFEEAISRVIDEIGSD